MSNNKKYFIRLAYDGLNFCGWQNQLDLESVQSCIEAALSRICRGEQKIIGCGRTDAGVHADDYYASWEFEGVLPDKLLVKLNSVLPQSIAIKEIFEVDKKNDARFDAISRKYYYYIHTAKIPIYRHYSYEIQHYKLDIELMQECAKVFLKYTEFLPFIKLNKDKPRTSCFLKTSELVQLDKNYYRYEISANRFLHNMVRRIVGSIVMVGRGRITISDVESSLKTQNPLPQIHLAPAHGLHLVEVKYPYLK